MKKGIFGITEMTVRHEINEAVRVHLELIAEPGYDPHHLLDEKWDEMFPGQAIVKCSYCGQWAARKTACRHCGAAV